ncbi:hypothetical protein SDC9_167405 [bioreactor metagenome]|uniref:SHSP domain-containing protein n=1 Tax=bioreactor metagenome TaxID=1076179 RepID=A0A645G2I5_9ZZZZ|nr:Hsp20/alpha crystallin family protein [Victivallaceae bacterium]
MIREFLPWKKEENDLSPTERRKGSADEFHKQFNELVNHFFGNDMWGTPANYHGGSFVPCFEVGESDDKITVTAELPGIDEKDVDVSIVDGILCVKGEKRSETDDEAEGYHFSERSYGSFQRSFALPDGLDLEKTDAKFKDGILKIMLPKDKSKKESIRKVGINKS